MLERITTQFTNLSSALPLPSLFRLTRLHFSKPSLPVVTPPLGRPTSVIMLSLSKPSAVLNSRETFLSHLPKNPFSRPVYNPDDNWKYYAAYAASAAGLYLVYRRAKKSHHFNEALAELEFSPGEIRCIKQVFQAHHLHYHQVKDSSVHNARVWIVEHMQTLAEEADTQVDTGKSWLQRVSDQVGWSDKAGKFYHLLGHHDKKTCLMGLQELDNEKYKAPLTADLYKDGLNQINAIVQTKNLRFHQRRELKK
jgi:hypothetical protein